MGGDPDPAAIEAMAEAMNKLLVPGNHTMREFATAALAALREAGFWVERWRSMGDAPIDQEFLLVNARGQIARGWHDEDAVHGCFLVGALWKPVAWQSLPPPPPEPRDG